MKLIGFGYTGGAQTQEIRDEVFEKMAVELDSGDSRLHFLKLLPHWFESVWRGEKKAEVRKEHRHFRKGDALILQEWSEEKGYTGRWVSGLITHMLSENQFPQGLIPGYIVISFTVIWKQSAHELLCLDGKAGNS